VFISGFKEGGQFTVYKGNFYIAAVFYHAGIQYHGIADLVNRF
jgi:tRNA splicing endonuclease